MYKFMFFAFVACAVFPDWPIEAMAAGQDIINGIQNKMLVISETM